MYSRRTLERAAALVVGACLLATLATLDFDGDTSELQFDGRRHLKNNPAAAASARPPRKLEAQAPADEAQADKGQDERPPRQLLAASSGLGPALTARDGRAYQLGDVPGQGVTWYTLLSSPKVQWNAAPYAWPSCPRDENTWLGHTSFSFHEPDAVSKHLRFRVERRDERECTWNFSKACLAGGSFVMNFGKSAKDMLYPGLYTLKTSEGMVRIVAYNSIRACTIKEPKLTTSQDEIPLKAPMDYLRRAVPSTTDPEACQAWIDKHPSSDELFELASDHATVHVDTPWMQVAIQVEQVKVKTEEECVHGGMNVWITDASSEIVADEFGGVLGKPQVGASTSRALRQGEEALEGEVRALKMVEGKAHVIDGPFGG